MFIISVSKYFSSIYLSLVLQLNTVCIHKGPPVLALVTFHVIACLVHVVGLMPPSLPSVMAITAAFVASIVVYVTACFIISESAVFLSFYSLILVLYF